MTDEVTIVNNLGGREEEDVKFYAERPIPKVGDVEFTLYGRKSTHPQVAVDTSARYIEKKPISEVPVRQYMGPNLDKITIKGECSPYEATRVDELEEEDIVDVRTARWSGKAQVDNTSTESAGKRYRQTWVYTYTIELTEVKK